MIVTINYMTQSFHFGAVDYLLNPVDDGVLEEAVKPAGIRLINDKDERIL